jgi:hypothetical protein
MRYKISERVALEGLRRHVVVDRGDEGFTSFPAKVGNSVYDSFLESQGLTDAEVQAMEPDEWHDMAASVI